MKPQQTRTFLSNNEISTLRFNLSKELIVKEQFMKLENKVIPPPEIILYDALSLSYTRINEYTFKEIRELIRLSPKSNYILIQINNDNAFFQKVLELNFKKKEIIDINKDASIENDYVFSPLKNLICFNLLLINYIDYEEVDKSGIQVYLYSNGILINNSKGLSHIFEILKTKYNFKEQSKSDFIEVIHFKKKFKEKNSKRKSFHFFTKRTHTVSFKDNQKISNKNYIRCSTKKRSCKSIERPIITSYLNEYSLFTPDDFLYWLISQSIDRTFDITFSLKHEVESIRTICFSLSENERPDFFKRLIYSQTFIKTLKIQNIAKLKFLLFLKEKVNLFNTITKNTYFKISTFHLLIEILLAKIYRIDYFLIRIEKILIMVKENYCVISRSNTQQKKKKFEEISKVLTIFSVLCAPINAICTVAGTNFRTPFQEVDNLIPFFSICGFLFIIIAIHVYILYSKKFL
jgi:Mg2+ and Co2+ transporter CorA